MSSNLVVFTGIILIASPTPALLIYLVRARKNFRPHDFVYAAVFILVILCGCWFAFAPDHAARVLDSTRTDHPVTIP